MWLRKKCIRAYMSKKMGYKGRGKRCAQEIREATVKGHLRKKKGTGQRKVMKENMTMLVKMKSDFGASM